MKNLLRKLLEILSYQTKNTGKRGHEKTPYLNTFHAVLASP